MDTPQRARSAGKAQTHDAPWLPDSDAGGLQEPLRPGRGNPPCADDDTAARTHGQPLAKEPVACTYGHELHHLGVAQASALAFPGEQAQ